jgi:hypothetical protein
MNYNEIFIKLWKDYALQNPSAAKIHDLFVSEGEVVRNDHIAFRTLNDPRINIDVLATVFTKNGYTQKGSYYFSEKHLNAKHYEHNEDANAPRVFISELIISDFSEGLQKVMNNWINEIPSDLYYNQELIYKGSVTNNPSFEIYNSLRAESEYAAWLYVFGFRANHFTVSINALKKHNSIEKVNSLLKHNGYPLNSSGGEIKGEKGDFLRQSSTLADKVAVKFTEGNYEVPACYYEFAERFPGMDGKLFSGFIEKSADKIFESTNFYQK